MCTTSFVRDASRAAAARLFPIALATLLSVAGPGPGTAQAPPADTADTGWPRRITAQNATVTIYQPQPEAFVGDSLASRAAVSVTPKGQSEPVFGAVWVAARVSTDRDARLVRLRSVKVTRVRFTDATPEQEQKLSALLEQEIPKWHLAVSLDRLTASLAAVKEEKAAAADLKTTPPKIRFATTPSVLILIDGQPQLRAMPESKLQRVVNTPALIVQDPGSNTYYLSGGKTWYSAKDPKGPWQPAEKVPSEVDRLVPDSVKQAADSGAAGGPPPKVIVALEPTELVVTTGEPDYAPIEGTDLLYVSNTDGDWLKDLVSQDHFLLLSGRWYRASKLEGPWTFVRSDRLPASFKKVPPESPKGDVLAFVAGTPQADDAVADAAIPQTAAVKRSEAKLEVQYDGEPKFEPVTGTEVEYAVNTETQVLRIKGKYYACDQGIWFVASSAKGPWAVSDSRPPEVDEIPASSPVYNVKYVEVYESTPEVVYVGYTPGYVGAYPYYGTVVYGTGWYYPPYIGPSYYYPRPATWGFHMNYNSWSGWSVGVSWGTPFLSIGVSFGGHGGYYGRPYSRPCCYGGGWYGAGGYRGPTVVNTGDINIGNRTNINTANRTNTRAGGNNIYNNPENRTRVANAPASGTTNASRSAPAATRQPNDVMADRDGSVARHTPEGGWETRQSGSWQSSGAAAASPDRSSLDREYQARERGAARAQQFQATRAAPRAGGRRF